MSIWDGIIILFLAIAIFQGYRRGFLLRMTGWVGGVIAFLFASPLASKLDSPISQYINGEAILSEWLKKHIMSEHQVGDFINGKNIYHWLDGMEDIRAYKASMLKGIEEAGADLYNTMASAISHTIAVPMWHLILTCLMWLVIMFVFVVVCRLIKYSIESVPVVGVIDAFVGALISTVVAFIVLIGVNTVLLYFFDDKTPFGAMLNHSFFAPFFKNIFDLFLS